ncbi:hypothetical protein QVD17_41690 [Tagetes erecta]|uniref:Uncharacterized protein n=1 Tax=Tagetes erecta TaxID=13708 RepID=A0AAD8JMZ3_TARER|nr:hypothetical protein QVD17_41690 [Tagetes erecta]
MDHKSLEIFSGIAYRCLKESREDRPKMVKVVKELQAALESQELHDCQEGLESEEFSEWDSPLIYYEEITKAVEPPLNYKSRVHLRKHLSKGVLLNDGKTWFYLDKNGKKCHMLSTRAAGIHGQSMLHQCLPESRFGEACQFDSQKLVTYGLVRYYLVSTKTIYASYLVYKLPEVHSRFEAPIKVWGENYLDLGYISWYIYLVRPQTPLIRPKDGESTHNPINKPKIKGLPQQRNDGWMEVVIWEFNTATTEPIYMGLQLETCGVEKLSGLIIQGIEIRPI